nr:MAG TPA: hypothetical protein [Caudoviricetes sp.]
MKDFEKMIDVLSYVFYTGVVIAVIYMLSVIN